MRHLFLFALLAVALAGCNTVEGLGRDIKAGGEALSDWASE